MGFRGAMDIDLPTEFGPTEETVEALMEYLVGPLLHLKHTDFAKDIPSESQQKSVAKQVHAAAVLYNYYHLNHHRESQFLKFDQFCKLAIMFKPSILHHMKYMTQSGQPVLNDPDKQLSVTEKAVMDACTISETLLNASDNFSSMTKEWPVTKVAVLLVDSQKEKCFLQFNHGVWSVIEKDIFSEESEGKKGNKRLRKYDEEGEIGFQSIAFSAVKEVTGIRFDKIKVLESHLVYSLSQAKTATRFYVLQSTQPISDDNFVPIQDVISSLQGPVVQQCTGSWVITPVVKYYYLLPYADIISHCLSRKSKLEFESKLELGSVHSSNSSKEEPCENKVSKNSFSSNKNSDPVSKVQDDVVTSRLIKGTVDQKVKQIENSITNKIITANNDSVKPNGSCEVESNSSSSGTNIKSIDKPLKVYHHEKRTHATNSNTGDLKDLKIKSTASQIKDEKVDDENKDCMVLTNEVKTLTVDHVEDFQITVGARISELSEAALRALSNKRQKLYDKKLNIEGELTLCDKKIETIRHGGIGDYLGLKLDVVIDCCNEICKEDDIKVQDHTNLPVAKSLQLSGKSLSAQLTLNKASQELDDICLSNSWMLPTYHTTRSDDGFVANVTVKGTNFECSGVSGIQPSINEARNSAATHVITKLQQMANELNT